VAISSRGTHEARLEVSDGFISGRESSTTKYLSARTVGQPFAGVDDRIATFCAVFKDLRKTFDSNLTLNTALVLSRARVTIDAMSANL
jgi:hypothetical protein